MIEVEVRRSVPGFTLDVAFAAGGGGITALFGRSGAGKTTIVNLIAGLERPDRGRITLDGEVVYDSESGVDLPPERRRLGYVFQEDRLFPHLSVRANLSYGLRLVPPAARRIGLDQVVTLLGLDGLLARRPARLSGGEKQRVQIGRALLTSPRLLLMDEPFANLDIQRRAEVLPFIESLRDEMGVPTVFVSHNIEEVVRLADTMILISDGRAEAIGPVEEVMSRLDLRPLTGRYEAGAVLRARVAEHDLRYRLTRLDFPGGTLLVSGLDLAPGTALKVRVRARDVALALAPPADISINNVLAATVAEIGEEPGPQVDVSLHLGAPGGAGSTLWARITRRSVEQLALAPGKPVYALIKSVALDRQSLGFRDTGARFEPRED